MNWSNIPDRDAKIIVKRLRPHASDGSRAVLLREFKVRTARNKREALPKRMKESEYIRHLRGISYEDTLLRRRNEKTRIREKVKEEMVHGDRIYKSRMASDSVMKKDTEYPRFLERSTPETKGDAYSGPNDPIKWGPRGHAFYWNRYEADRKARPMSLLVERHM